MPLVEAVRRTADGIPYLAPEIVLFVKAKHARPKDVADRDNVVPTLDARARQWLLDAIELLHPGHDWLRAIAV